MLKPLTVLTGIHPTKCFYLFYLLVSLLSSHSCGRMLTYAGIRGNMPGSPWSVTVTTPGSGCLTSCYLIGTLLGFVTREKLLIAKLLGFLSRDVGRGYFWGTCLILIAFFFSLLIFEHTCAFARWAHMDRFLSVCPSVCNWTKLLDQNSDYKIISHWTINVANCNSRVKLWTDTIEVKMVLLWAGVLSSTSSCIFLKFSRFWFSGTLTLNSQNRTDCQMLGHRK